MTLDNHGRPSRGLPFPLRDAEFYDAMPESEGVVTKTTADFFPVDQNEKIDVVFNLSFNEFTAIASSVDIGRDIGYGENSTLVWWTWIRSLVGIGGAAVTCEDIADCIEENAATQAAIASAIGSSTTIQDTIINQTGGLGNPNQIVGNKTKFADRNPPGTLENDSIKDLLECDKNVLWGGLRYGLVERADDDVRSVLESLAAISSIPDRLIEFIELIPVAGDLIQATLDLATEAIPALLTLFDSYSSLDHMDEYACGLFDIVCSECRYPTFQEVWDYNKSFGITTMPEMAAAVFQAIMDAVVGSTETASQIAYFTLMNMRLGTLLLQATFNGKSGTNAVLRDVVLGEDFANDNWLVNCSTCNESYMLWTWDFKTQGRGESYPDTAQNTSKAVFEAGKGWRAVNHSTGRRFDICFPHNPAWKIRAVAFNQEGTADNGYNWTRRPTWGSTSGQQGSSAGLSNATWSHYFDGYASLTGINEILFFSQYPAAAAVWLTKVSVLYDTGFAPSSNVVATNDITPYG